jgi:hypothetical protein
VAVELVSWSVRIAYVAAGSPTTGQLPNLTNELHQTHFEVIEKNDGIMGKVRQRVSSVKPLIELCLDVYLRDATTFKGLFSSNCKTEQLRTFTHGLYRAAECSKFMNF